MKKFILFLFVLCTSNSYPQTIVLEMIKNAKDSIAANRFESASRILDGASVYGVYSDSISYWRKEMKKKGIDISYEKYKEWLFDISVKYYLDVTDNDSNEIVNHYWMAIAPKMCLSSRLIAAVNLQSKGKILGEFIQQHLKRKISKEKYLMILEAILKADILKKEEDKRNVVDASFLYASQDEITKKWGFRDPKGVLLIPFEYDEILSDFKSEVAIVKQNGIYGFLHYTGVSTFNMSDAKVWNTTGDNELIITPNIKLGGKTVKQFFEEIQNMVTY